MARPLPDLTGRKVGQLTVECRHSGLVHQDRLRTAWWCTCECGNKVVVRHPELNSGRAKCCFQCRKRLFHAAAIKRKLPPGQAARNSIISSYRVWAKKCNRTFSLTKEEIEVLFEQDCHYCGAKPAIHNLKHCSSSCKANGIDRVDSRGGYTAHNVVSCCRRCNSAKSDMDVIEFKQWIHRVHYHLSRKESS